MFPEEEQNCKKIKINILMEIIMKPKPYFVDNHIYYYSSVSKKSALELNIKLREVENKLLKNITTIIIIKNIFIYISIVLVVVFSPHFPLLIPLKI